MHCPRVVIAAIFAAWLPAAGGAQAPAAEVWNAKFQATYIGQAKPAFAAPYSGANSLSGARETSYSFTATAAFGLRLRDDTEIYFNPEVAQGVPLSHLTGLGGFTNGEMARTSGPNLTFYGARTFLRQTWSLGGAEEALESEANRLAGRQHSDRLVLTAGNLSVLDVFDKNAYSHDPRTQFMNWALMTHGAFDYAADARGYSWGLALEFFDEEWAVRAGRFIEPKQPDQQALDPDIFRHYGDQIEIERAHRIGELPGRARLLVYRNRAVMSRFRDAVNAAAGAAPDLDAVRYGEQTKTGAGVNVEQAIASTVGVFARAMWADGQTETYSFTEIDRSVAAGALLMGRYWARAQDSLGVALAGNALSPAHRDFLAAGGRGFFLGDGRLNYRPEIIVELFYNVTVARGVWAAVDLQHIQNPGYNADRGPANAVALRLHTEF